VNPYGHWYCFGNRFLLGFVGNSMRPLFLLLLGAFSVCAQPFSFGVKGGVPLTDFVDIVQSPDRVDFHTNTSRYIVGPTVELRLPFGFGVELDALYRHLNYTSSGGLIDTIANSKTTGNAWEFPLLAKYRFPSEVVRPYVDAGIAWDTLQGLKQTVTNTVIASGITTTTTTSNPAELHKNTTTGFVIGAGIDVHALLIHISPEVRYTRWGAQHFLSSNGGLQSSQNQAEFLLGITF
jgi:opacity protein-like surface antigen